MSVRFGTKSWAAVVRDGVASPRVEEEAIPRRRLYCAVARMDRCSGVVSFRPVTRPQKKYTVIRGEAVSPFNKALQEGNEERVRRLVLENPSFLLEEEERGYSVVDDACFHGVSSSLLRFLIDRGANVYVMCGSDATTPKATALARWHEHLLELFPRQCSITEFILDSKAVGHVVGISRRVSLVEGAHIYLEGLWSTYWHDLFSKGIKGYVRHCASHLTRYQLTEMDFQLKMDNFSCIKLELCQTQLRDDTPFVIDTGWEGHSIFTLFWRSYLIVCDPSAFGVDSTIQVYKIDSELITQEIIDEISLQHVNATHEEGIEYFSSTLPKALVSERVEMTPEDREIVGSLSRLAPPPIEIGICTFASLSNALRVIGFCTGVAKSRGGDVAKVERRMESDFKRVLAYMQGQVLFEYLYRWTKHPRMDVTMMWKTLTIVQRELLTAFPHLHDVPIETRYGEMRGDDLLKRCRALLRGRRQRRRHHGRR